jgi:hypothetical protein
MRHKLISILIIKIGKKSRDLCSYIESCSVYIEKISCFCCAVCSSRSEFYSPRFVVRISFLGPVRAGAVRFNFSSVGSVFSVARPLGFSRCEHIGFRFPLQERASPFSILDPAQSRQRRPDFLDLTPRIRRFASISVLDFRYRSTRRRFRSSIPLKADSAGPIFLTSHQGFVGLRADPICHPTASCARPGFGAGPISFCCCILVLVFHCVRYVLSSES